ncbi:hypothetical protein CDN97_09370 [Pantoea sp. AMG 501]|jgi:hypothetical protein|nr:hypothetical protein CDN97_09370 [Pantoea sp. AMG 501]
MTPFLFKNLKLCILGIKKKIKKVIRFRMAFMFRFNGVFALCMSAICESGHDMFYERISVEIKIIFLKKNDKRIMRVKLLWK